MPAMITLNGSPSSQATAPTVVTLQVLAPTPAPKAIDQLDAWLESPTLALLGESQSHWAPLRGLVLAGRIAGRRIHDARIAAICHQHDVHELWTADRDFQHFPKLRTRNPLVGG
jgi:predicted nucleic acid-binding protein